MKTFNLSKCAKKQPIETIIDRKGDIPQNELTITSSFQVALYLEQVETNKHTGLTGIYCGKERKN